MILFQMEIFHGNSHDFLVAGSDLQVRETFFEEPGIVITSPMEVQKLIFPST